MRNLLAFLVVNLSGTRTSIIATYRTDEMSRTHPFRGVLAELDRSPRARHLLLKPFDQAELAAYAYSKDKDLKAALQAFSGSPTG